MRAVMATTLPIMAQLSARIGLALPTAPITSMELIISVHPSLPSTKAPIGRSPLGLIPLRFLKRALTQSVRATTTERMEMDFAMGVSGGGGENGQGEAGNQL